MTAAARDNNIEPLPARSDRLLLINIVNTGAELILQTVSTTTPDHRAGHRRTDIERIANAAALRRRLAELAEIIFAGAAMLAVEITSALELVGLAALT
jgi:hypothetical protein